MARNNCQFHDLCGNKEDHPESGTCHACYGALWYWLKGKTPTAILKRQKKLKLYQARMESIANTRVLTQPQQRRSRRRRAA